MAIKTDSDGIPILNEGASIADAVNTLIFTIAQHFIGDPSLIKDRSGELLSNLKCRTLGDFRWYKDTFLTRVYTRDDSHQPFWKEKFLAGLPTSLGDKVREKLRGQNPNGDIPYDQLSYGQLIAYIQKVALKICQDDKIQKQLAKEKSITVKIWELSASNLVYLALRMKIPNQSITTLGQNSIETNLINLIENMIMR
jgi:hypothetical protein